MLLESDQDETVEATALAVPAPRPSPLCCVSNSLEMWDYFALGMLRPATPGDLSTITTKPCGGGGGCRHWGVL